MPLVLSAILLAFGLAGCTQPEAPGYLYGHNLTQLEFEITDLKMGIHPDTSVLEDENNPFRGGMAGPEIRWVINDEASHAAGFYSWATLLANQPIGENQYYTALKLRALHDEGEVSAAALPFVRDMAIGAFQAVLDHFPGSATYDITGTIPYRLAPLAYQQILEMGGSVEGGWVLVQTANGGVEAVQIETDL
jgi:hypothetical protein